MSDIIAIGGGGFLAEPRNLALEKYIVDQTQKDRPKVLMIATARGDAAEYVATFHAAFGQLGATTQHLPFFDRTPMIRDVYLLRMRYSSVVEIRRACLRCGAIGRCPTSSKRRTTRHRSRRSERRCDLLVRTGRHRFVGRSSEATRLPGNSQRQLLSALRWRNRA